MDKIDVVAIGDIAIQRVIALGNCDLVPTDLRDFQAIIIGEADDIAVKNTEASGAGIEFLAFVEQRLVTDTNSEEWFAGADEIARGFEQLLFAEGVDAIVKRAHAGKDKAAGIADLIGMLDETHIGPNLEKRFVDATQVAGAVIK